MTSTRPVSTDRATTTRGFAGDLARRVSHRRLELGLTTEQVAQRAGIDPSFLAYFEQSSDTSLGGSALLRLAVALETTPLALEGGQIDLPSGGGRAGPNPGLEALTADACEGHLRAGGIGRIVFTTPSGPVALPVNFAFSNGQVVFRTSAAMAAAIVGVVAFEVDHIDETMSTGWSVLVRGTAGQIEENEAQLATRHLDLDPWAGGARLYVIGITPVELTGRVIVQRPPDHH